MTITRAVLYARVSTDRQAQEGVSLDSQLEMARTHCEAKEWSFSGAYTDAGWSGRNDKRPELARLIADAERKAFDVVIVYKLDRLGRSARKVYDVLGRFQDAEVSFVSLTQDLNTLTSQGKAMTGFYTIMAEMESDMTSERVKAAMRHMVASGRHYGGTTPLGYHLHGGKFLPVEQEAEVIRAIFRAFLETGTFTAAREQVNASGHRSKTGSLFSVQTIRDILSNPVYTGCKAWGKNEIRKTSKGKRTKRLTPEKWIISEGEHDPIIEQETWHRAQAIIEKNRGLNPRAIYGKQRYPWSGLLRCSNCGSTMNRAFSNRREGRRYYFYTCSRYSNYGTLGCDSHGHVGEGFLDDLIPFVSDAICVPVEQASDLASKPKKRKGIDNAKKIADLEAKKSREKNLYREGLSGFDELRSRIAAIDKKIGELGSTQDRPAMILNLPVSLSEAWGQAGDTARGLLLREIVDYGEVGHEKLTLTLKDGRQLDFKRGRKVTLL